jgi:hypothetical protein
VVCLAVNLLQDELGKKGVSVPPGMEAPKVIGTDGEGITRIKGGARIVGGAQNTGTMSPPNPAAGVAAEDAAQGAAVKAGVGIVGRVVGAGAAIVAGIVVESIQAREEQPAHVCAVEGCPASLVRQAPPSPVLEPAR